MLIPSLFATSGVDIPTFFLVAKYLFVLLFGLWLLFLARRPDPRLLVAGALGFSLYPFVAGSLLLERPYALRPGLDRMVNLAMSATAATGHSAFESYQVGAADHEPWWRLVMRVASLGEPENVLLVYQLLPPLVMALIAIAIAIGLGWWSDDGETRNDRRWELGLILYAVFLLSSSPQDRLGVFNTFWMTLLQKPNHAFGFVLLPLFVGAFTSRRPALRSLGAAALLALLSWVFLMHWSYLLLGLMMYPFVARRLSSPPEWKRVLLVIVIGCLGALPYLWHLFFSYLGVPRGGTLEPKPGFAEGYLNVFSIGYEHGFLFFLSVWGVLAMWRRRRREDVVLVSMLAGCLAGWLLYLVALAIGKALQPEEFYFYTRFLLSLAAGTGAFTMLSQCADRLGDAKSLPRLVCLFCLVTLPLNLAYWWNPPLMDRYYPISLEPLPGEVEALCRWVREEVSRDAVFEASADTASWIAALSGRRVLLIGDYRPPPDYDQRAALVKRMRDDRDPEAFRDAKRRYHLSHLVVDLEDLADAEDRGDGLETMAWLRPTYESAGFRVYEIGEP